MRTRHHNLSNGGDFPSGDCAGRIPKGSGIFSDPCKRMAIVKRGALSYCGLHDPERADKVERAAAYSAANRKAVTP